MDFSIREMTIDDYDQAYRLWVQTEGLSLGESDCKEGISLYLRRNPGLCFVATVGKDIAGTILCGHEGRRGILRHLVVKSNFRRKGIARSLVNECLCALGRDGIKKCNTFVDDTNAEGRRFWEHLGWHVLEDNYRTMQSVTTQGKGF